MNSSCRKLRRSLSESCITRSTSSKKLPTIDPFQQFSSKLAKTPLLKPTCHKKSHSEKTLKPQKPQICMKKSEMSNFFTLGSNFSTKVIKKSVFHPKVKSGIFTEKNLQFVHQTTALNNKIIETINPSFSAKTSERSTTDDIKPVLRTRKAQGVQTKSKIKMPSVSKKMIKKVESLFKEKSFKNKSALDFSFADPEA